MSAYDKRTNVDKLVYASLMIIVKVLIGLYVSMYYCLSVLKCYKFIILQFYLKVYIFLKQCYFAMPG